MMWAADTDTRLSYRPVLYFGAYETVGRRFARLGRALESEAYRPGIEPDTVIVTVARAIHEF